MPPVIRPLIHIFMMCLTHLADHAVDDDGCDPPGGLRQPGELEAAADQGRGGAGHQLISIVQSAGQLEQRLVRPDQGDYR